MAGASWQRQPASAEAAPACLAELQPTGARTRAEGHQSVVDSGRNAAEGAQPADEQKVLAIDKSGLKSVPEHEHGEQPHKGSETPLLRHLKALIRGLTSADVNLLDQSGAVDLSVHVAFSALRQAVTEGGADVACHGPVPQAHFLRSLGAGARLEVLKRIADPAYAAALQTGYGSSAVRRQSEALHEEKLSSICNHGR